MSTGTIELSSIAGLWPEGSRVHLLVREAASLVPQQQPQQQQQQPHEQPQQPHAHAPQQQPPSAVSALLSDDGATVVLGMDDGGLVALVGDDGVTVSFDGPVLDVGGANVNAGTPLLVVDGAVLGAALVTFNGTPTVFGIGINGDGSDGGEFFYTPVL